MNQDTNTRLQLLLSDVVRRGIVYYEELDEVFPSGYAGGPELDAVLSQLERAGIEMLPSVAISRDESDPEDPDHPLRVYLREVAKVPLLSLERENELAAKIATSRVGADREKKQLVEANLALVVRIARQYGGVNLSLLELIEQGNRGLMLAADRFVPSRGYRFPTFAQFWTHRSLYEWISAAAPEREPPAHLR